MQRPRILIILLQSRTATQDLWQPELPHGTLHMPDLALCRRRRLNPLGWLAAHTAHHVGMREGLRGTLLRLDVQCGGDGLGDAGVQRGGPAGDHEGLVVLVAGSGAAITVAGAGTHEGGVCAQRGSHCEVCVFLMGGKVAQG